VKTGIPTTSGEEFFMDADDVMLKKMPDKDSSSASVLDEMIMWSRNKPLTKDEIEAIGPSEKKDAVGLEIRPWATVKMFNEGRERPKPVVIIGIQGTF
jgi:hypothetical protein